MINKFGYIKKKNWYIVKALEYQPATHKGGPNGRPRWIPINALLKKRETLIMTSHALKAPNFVFFCYILPCVSSPMLFFFFFLKQEASNLPPPLYLFIIFFEDSNIQPNTHPRRYRTTSPTPIHQVCCLLCLSHVHIDVFQLIYNFLTLYTPSYFFSFWLILSQIFRS